MAKHKKTKQTPASKSTADKPPMQTTLDAKAQWQHWLFLLVLPAAVYARVLGFDFSYHDDDVMILDGARILAQPFSFQNLFLTDAWLQKQVIELYRPLQSVSYWIDYQIAGAKPGWYHAHNLLLHLLNGLLVWQLLRLLSRHAHIALLGAMIWSLHFVNTHAVCWIPARGDVLLATWGVLFLISWLNILQKNHAGWYVLHAISFGMALLAKENAILLPALAGLLWWLRLPERKARVAIQRLLPAAVAWAVIAPVYLWLRGQSIANQAQNLNLQAFVYNLRVWPETLYKLLLPEGFSTMPGYSSRLTISGLFIIAVVAFWIYRMARRQPEWMPLLWFCTAWVVLPLLPSMFYQPVFVSYGYDYLDHRLYFPSIGVALALAVGLWPVLVALPKYRRIAALVLLALFFILPALRNMKNYRNYQAYYANATRTNPRSALALTNLGILERKAGRIEEAEKWLTRAMKVAPQYDLLQVEYAALLNDKGQYAQALELWNQLLARPQQVRMQRDYLLCQRGLALARLGRPNQALQDFEAAIALNDRDPVYWQNKGAALEDLARDAEALDAYSRALALKPDLPQSLYRRGFLHGKAGRPQQAIADLNEAIRLDASRREFFYYRAMAYKDLQDMTRFCADMRQAAAMQLPEAEAAMAQFCN